MAMAHRTIDKPNSKAGKKDPKAEPIRRPIRVAVFEDNDSVFFGYKELLTSQSSGSVINDKPTLSVEEAIEIFLCERPDVVITDLSLADGGTEGFEILRRIKEISPTTPVGLSTASYHPDKKDEINQEIRKQGFDALFQKHEMASMCDFIDTSASKS
jgi:DNA-binding NarL/FixJ family response regulator